MYYLKYLKNAFALSRILVIFIFSLCSKAWPWQDVGGRKHTSSRSCKIWVGALQPFRDGAEQKKPFLSLRDSRFLLAALDPAAFINSDCSA